MTSTKQGLAATATILLLAATPILAATASEGDGERTDEVQAMSSANLSAMDAAKAATGAVPGKIYELGFDVAKSGPVWNVTVVDQGGAEMLVTVDAGSGAILFQRKEGEHADGMGDDANEQGEGGESGEDSD